MQQWEYEILVIKADPEVDAITETSLDGRGGMDKLGKEGYELKSTNVVEGSIYLFFMRPKQ